MKNIFIILAVLPFFVSAQVTENFDDGDFTNNPAWVGDVASWQVVGGQLNSNNLTVNSSYYLSTTSTLATGALWEIWVNFKQSTSSANYMDIYLTSDIQDLNGSGNGYFVRIGGTSDEISLYSKISGASTKIIDGTDGRSQVSPTDNYFKIKVTRTSANLWTLFDDNTGGSNFFTEGTITDANFTTSAYFGISVTQSTASFFNKHFFDSIMVGNIVIDLTPPAVSSINVTSANEIDVIFNEPVEQLSAETTSNYSVNNSIGNPNAASLTSANTVHLTFGNNFANGVVNTLTVINVKDISNNPIVTPSTGQFTYFAPVPFSAYDIVINEIMADPDPPQGLPNYEFLELFNRKNMSVNMNNWTITAGSTTKTFTNTIMNPGSYLLLCIPAAAAELQVYGTVNPLFTSSTTLTNGGTYLVLKDNTGNTVDSVKYDLSWYRDGAKEDGGYSLERIDPDYTCHNSLNWMASNDPLGGTPGKVNSVKAVFLDAQTARLTRAYISGTNKVTAVFSKPMNSLQISTAANYSADNAVGVPTQATLLSSVSVELTFAVTGFQPGIIYTLTANASITDCPGNAIAKATARFAIPDSSAASDLLINEVLYHPSDSGAEFIELYNPSSKVIDLAQHKVCEIDIANNAITTSASISDSPFLIFPGDYMVLTKDATAVMKNYYTPDPDNFVNVISFPSLNDTGDAFTITNSSGVRLDQFSYTDKYQFPLLNDDKGVSLERIGFNRPTQDSTNWHSAAETVGFATPAYENSQHAEAIDDGSEVSVEPEVFSPDNDGNSDVVNINYHFGEPGYTANLKIFDSKGRLIIHLIKNELLGIDGTFTWNGITDENLKAKVGIYVIYLEAFNETGTVKKFKKPVVLASKL